MFPAWFYGFLSCLGGFGCAAHGLKSNSSGFENVSYRFGWPAYGLEAAADAVGGAFRCVGDCPEAVGGASKYAGGPAKPVGGARRCFPLVPKSPCFPVALLP